MSEGTVGSRFVSESDLEAAKQRKQEEWKAAYARLGQEPPPAVEEEEYDPRSLYEKLDAQKQAKKEQWDEKMKLSNQFRGLEADELQFLDEVAKEKKDKERMVKEQESEELRAFKAMQNRQQLPIPSPPIASTSGTTLSSQIQSESQPSTPAASKSVPASTKSTAKSSVKNLLRGVKVAKKPSTTRQPPTGGGRIESALGSSASHATEATSKSKDIASVEASGDHTKLQVDHRLYESTPPKTSTSTPPSSSNSTPKPTSAEQTQQQQPTKRKLPLGADYGSDSDEDEEQGEEDKELASNGVGGSAVGVNVKRQKVDSDGS